MIKVIKGDLLVAPADFIAHQANCRGVMGAGLAKQIRETKPKLYEIYRGHCRNYKAQDLLGKSFIYDRIITIFGQLNFGYDKSVVYTDYNALRKAFNAIHSRLPIDKSIAFPYGFGCGLANGKWEIVKDLITECFTGRDILLVVKAKPGQEDPIICVASEHQFTDNNTECIEEFRYKFNRIISKLEFTNYLLGQGFSKETLTNPNTTLKQEDNEWVCYLYLEEKGGESDDYTELELLAEQQEYEGYKTLEDLGIKY